MCGRFTLDLDQRFYPRFNLSQKELLVFDCNYNIAPGNNSVIITASGTTNTANIARFGFIPVWAKDDKIAYKMINAKAETILDKPSFKHAVQTSRCLVPVTGFYEWKLEDDGSKTPYYFYQDNEKYLALAGICSRWENKATDKTITSFAIITTAPNASVKKLHERMPLILENETEKQWLDKNLDIKYLTKILNNSVETRLQKHQVSKKVNYAEHNSPDLIAKITD